MFAIWLAGAACNAGFAQQHKTLVSEKEHKTLVSEKDKLLTHEMLVTQYHFPVKKNTGNPEKDQQVYAATKQKWVAANQELYRRYNSQGIKSSKENRRKTQPVLSPSK
ncbi:hypothetical protein I5M27_06155 [Adhaeribacter sp. BT258]|uniref:Uncharacterized protein n=1 Tax=Adhaeribacter terrigena TaxID=2793070 RepID=A0ABS1C1X4_9BACT|nr:hypothetical protein [Adhaeribacter terrigena]MBK0402560.1 hypothetical protein [Adhaeribacter terrigena]